jgi:hypothetical protein
MVAPSEVQEAKKVDMKVAEQLGFNAVVPDAPLVGGPVGVAPEFAAKGKTRKQKWCGRRCGTGAKLKQEDLDARLERLKGFAQDSKEGPGVVSASAFDALMVEQEECVASLPIVSVEGLPNVPVGKCVGSGSLKLTKINSSGGSSHRVHIHITTSDNQMSASESVSTGCCVGVNIFARYTSSHEITSHAFVTNVEQFVHHCHYTVKNVAQSVRQLQNGAQSVPHFQTPEAPQSDDCCAGCCGCCGGSEWSNTASYTSAMEEHAAAAKLEAGQTPVPAKFPEVQEMTLQQKHARAMIVQQELTMVLRQSANASSRCVVTFDAHTKAEDIMRFSTLLSSLACPGPEAPEGPSASKWILSTPSMSSGWSCMTCGRWKTLIVLCVIVVAVIIIVPRIGGGRDDNDNYEYTSKSNQYSYESYSDASGYD